MATAQEIIDSAWRKIGFRDNVAADDAEALTALNNMVSTWGLDILSPYRVRESFTITSATGTYTYGSGGTLDSVRPNLITEAYLENSDGISTPLEILSARDFSGIAMKAQTGRPEGFYYIPEYPLGKVIFDRKPEETYTFWVEAEKHITEFATLGTTVLLPNEYKEALVYNLSIRLAEDKGVALPQTVTSTATELKYLISRLVDANKPIPEAQFDFTTGKGFDINLGE